jgi:hypothetical protein
VPGEIVFLIVWLKSTFQNDKNAFASGREKIVLDAFANHEKRLLASSCLSARMDELFSQWTSFHKILCLSNFVKFVQKFQVLLQSDKSNILMHIYDIWLNPS